jgi:hypothetical protein
MWWSVAFVVALAVGVPGPASAKPSPAQKCAAAKLKAAAKKLSAKLACHQTALMHAAAPSATCLAHATSAFTLAFARAEAKGGCAVTGDAASVEAEVDAAVTSLVADFPVVPTTTSTTVTTSTTTTSTSTTTLPPCSGEGSSGCGSCGSGVCVRLCPGTTLVCVNNNVGTIQNCSDDTVCSAGRNCVANGPQCGTGSVNGCFAPCP